MAEGEDQEVKSQYHGGDQDRLQVVKTIVAMANTCGGTIQLERVSVAPYDLDSARLDDLANRYVEPRLGGITSEPTSNGGMKIEVRESEHKPHIFFVEDGRYRDRAKDREEFVFRRGQVWVRHSSKNEPARGDDMQRMVRAALAGLLTRLSVEVQERGLPLAVELGAGGIPMHMSERDGMAVRLSDEEGAVPVVPDLERVRIYLTHPATCAIFRP